MIAMSGWWWAAIGTAVGGLIAFVVWAFFTAMGKHLPAEGARQRRGH